MRNFMILAESIQYIEQNLCEPITRAEIARHCYVSLSMLEKLFRYALRVSIKEYVTKRRMTLAAKDLADSAPSITELAMKYQFQSVETFSRAFKRVWNVSPSDFTQKWKFTGIFPKIDCEIQNGEDFMVGRRKVDVSDAYDYLKEKQGSYVLCFDMRHLTEINAVSNKAGDLALLEMASRIDSAASEDMLLLRVGGDEFALITGLYGENKAKALGEEVLRHNGSPIQYEDQANIYVAIQDSKG